jgi:hypothetical protein
MTADKVEPTEADKKLTETADALKEEFKSKMLEYRAIWLEDETNDYPFFIYIASLMNFIEYHNKGCLTELGMLSLKVDISGVINSLMNSQKITQKELIKFLLNILNSYAISVLCKGMIEFSKEEPKFFEVNDFPEFMITNKDFEKINLKFDTIIPALKKALDQYTPSIDGKYVKIFNEEKIKGFVKPVFEFDGVKIRSGIPNNIQNAKAMN